jgi:carbonic anhydrase/acetyltransferase-like protein (isoleucine patch superfamily)
VADPFTRAKSWLWARTCPLFFQKIGAGSRLFGRVRLPRLLTNVLIGRHCMIGEAVHFQTSRTSRITIGDHSSLNTGCHLVATQGIEIGDHVAIGEYVSLRDNEHLFDPNIGVIPGEYDAAPIFIGERVWIGRGCYIGPGVTLSSGTIVAANSVVRAGHYPPAVLLAGAPATVRKTLSTKSSTGEAA